MVKTYKKIKKLKTFEILKIRRKKLYKKKLVWPVFKPIKKNYK
jgi:hypothetical protein